jgi:hypothetical protein
MTDRPSPVVQEVGVVGLSRPRSGATVDGFAAPSGWPDRNGRMVTGVIAVAEIHSARPDVGRLGTR